MQPFVLHFQQNGSFQPWHCSNGDVTRESNTFTVSHSSQPCSDLHQPCRKKRSPVIHLNRASSSTQRGCQRGGLGSGKKVVPGSTFAATQCYQSGSEIYVDLSHTCEHTFLVRLLCNVNSRLSQRKDKIVATLVTFWVCKILSGSITNRCTLLWCLITHSSFTHVELPGLYFFLKNAPQLSQPHLLFQRRAVFALYPS